MSEVPTAWKIGRLAWLPPALCALCIGFLWTFVPQEAHDQMLLRLSLATVFNIAVPLFVSFLAGRSFLRAGHPSQLALGCAMLLWAIAGMVAVTAVGPAVNTQSTIYTSCLTLSALCHLVGALIVYRWREPLGGRKTWLCAGYGTALSLAACAWAAANAGWLPVFFVHGHGGTTPRLLLLVITMSCFAVTAGLVGRNARRFPSAFLRWYALGLALLAIGAVGMMAISVAASYMSWAVRITISLGGLYMLVGALAAIRESQAWELPLVLSLEEAKDQYELVFQSSNDGMVLHQLQNGSRSDYFLQANQAICKLLGYSEEEMRQLRPQDIVVREDHAAMYRDRAILREQRMLVHEKMLLTKSGRRVPVEISTRIFDHREREMALSVIRDITERRRAQEELREAARRKDEFLAMLAHELRNPLSAAQNAALVLDTEASAEDRAWAVQVISRQIGQLAHLVDDLLEVARITSGKIRLRRRVLDAAEVLDRAVETARPLVDARRHLLCKDYPGGSLWLEADAARLEQIVANLLTNAVKYTDAGGRIWLTAVHEGNDVVISVRDTGIGIPPAKLPGMWELFAQGERNLARSEGGLGIGLTIVRTLTEIHGGSVDATSEGSGRGSTFSVRLPGCAAPQAVEAGKPEVFTPSAAGVRVLVVDDNVDSAQGISRLLRRAGHEVALAHDGPAGLELARRWRPQAYLLDLGLPGMTGYQLLEQLHKHQVVDGALTVAISGYGQAEDLLRSRQAGFHHHLVKPLNIDTLRKLLHAPAKDWE